MDTNETYIKYFYILANTVLTVFVIVTANFILSPMIAAFIVAILLSPIYSKLIKLGVPKAVSASISVLIFLVVIALLISFITTQLSYIATDPSVSSQPLVKTIGSIQHWLARFYDFSLQDQSHLMEESITNFIKNIVGYAPNVFSVTTVYLSMILLFIMSLFFFLYYNTFFLSFIYKLFGRKNKEQVSETADKIKLAVENYIVGLFIVISTIAVLNSLGLLLIGLNHAIFFGVFGALLTIIPYIGILIASLFPAILTLITTGSIWYALAVVLVFGVVQFFEGNFITPYIMGHKENINPYVAILGLFVGGSLLGAIGVILVIPLLGILKIICDDIESLQPIGYVLGNPPRQSNTLLNWISRLLKPKK